MFLSTAHRWGVGASWWLLRQPPFMIEEKLMIRITLKNGVVAETTRHTVAQVRADQAAYLPILVGGPDDGAYNGRSPQIGIDPAEIRTVEEVPV